MRTVCRDRISLGSRESLGVSIGLLSGCVALVSVGRDDVVLYADEAKQLVPAR